MSESHFGIRPDYRHGKTNLSLEEHPGDYWTRRRLHISRFSQWDVYQWAEKLTAQPEVKKVCDLGCGPAHKMVRFLEPGAEAAVGIDQEATIAVASSIHPGSQFTSIDLDQDIASVPGPFDLVVCADVIEHLENPDRLLEMIRRLTDPNGVVLLSTPERDRLRGPNCLESPKAEHLREWTFDEFHSYLEANGFEVLEHRICRAFLPWRDPLMAAEWVWTLMRGRTLHSCQAVLCRPKEPVNG